MLQRMHKTASMRNSDETSRQDGQLFNEVKPR